MVMWFHYFQDPDHQLNSGLYRWIVKTASIGQTGVDLFFVLSGFLITRILLEQKGQPKYFRNFYARRSLRIFPLYYFYLSVVLVLLPLLQKLEIPSLSQQWYWWCFLQNVPLTFGQESAGPFHYWSLAVEEHFYLVWPFLVFFLPTRLQGSAAWSLIFGACVSRVVMLSFELPVFYFTLARMDAMAIGALLALNEDSIRSNPTRSRKAFVAAGVCAFAGLLPLYFAFSGSGAGWLQTIKFPLVAAAYACVIGVCLTLPSHSTVKKLLESRWMCWVGSISFGLYIYHGLCFHFCDFILGVTSPLLMLPLCFMSAALIAVLSFHLLEKPFLSLKRYF